MITLWMPTLFDAIGSNNQQPNQSNHHVYVYQNQPADSQDPWQGYVNLAAVAKAYPNADVCLYVPSTSLLQLSKWISTKQSKQLGETGLRYLFEEMTLTPVEQLQVKIYSVGDMQQLYALPQTQIEQWQYATELVGLKLVAVLPDYLLLPIPETGQRTAYLYFDKQTLLMRRSASHGSAVGYLPLIAQQWTDNQPHTTSTNESSQTANHDLNAVNNEDNSSTNSIPSLEIESLKSVYVISSANLRPFDHDDAAKHITSNFGWYEGINHLMRHGIDVHHSQANLTPVAQPTRHPLNFYHIKRPSILSPYLKTVAAVATVALTLQLMVDALQIHQYNTAISATQTAIREQYQTWYPNERLNERTQLQTQLSPKLITTDTQNTGTQLKMQQISTLIRQSNVTVSMLNMQAEQLQMTLIANNRQSLDSLVANLQQAGINARLGSVSNMAANTAQTDNNTPSEQIQGQLLVTLDAANS